MDENQNINPEDQEIQRVVFNYIKSPFFRSIHADGAIGGPTPRGYLHFAFFSERAAIPKRIAHSVENGTIDQEHGDVDGLSGFVRELEVDVFVDLAAAVQFHNWLSKAIQNMAKQSNVTLEINEQN